MFTLNRNGCSPSTEIRKQIVALAPEEAELTYFRTAAGAEIDLVMTLGEKRFAFEIKYSMSPKPSKGFWTALHDLAIEQAWIVAPVEHSYPLAENVQVIPLAELPAVLDDERPAAR